MSQKESEISDIEAILARLAPTSAAIDPVAAAYLAGRLTGRRNLLAWRSVAVLAIALAIGGRLVPRASPPPQSSPSVNSVEIAESGPSTQIEPVPSDNVAMLERAVLDRGLAALPRPHPMSADTATQSVPF